MMNREIGMERDDAVEILERRGVKPTANRLLVVRELLKSLAPVNLAKLEESLDTVDKASIFRVLELFAAKEIVHVIEDGSRSLKYELCHCGEHHDISHQHVHFYCEVCKETFCLENVHVPKIDVPQGFVTKSANFVIKGVCPDCSHSAHTSHK